MYPPPEICMDADCWSLIDLGWETVEGQDTSHYLHNIFCFTQKRTDSVHSAQIFESELVSIQTQANKC